MDEMDIIVHFAKLWGIETADSRLIEGKYRAMESYDSAELLDLFVDWKNEYLKDEEADDAVEFFYQKFNALMGLR